jgi:hypothetical protein
MARGCIMAAPRRFFPEAERSMLLGEKISADW